MKDIDILHQQSVSNLKGILLYAQCINFTDSNSTLILFLLMKSTPFLYQWIKVYNKSIEVIFKVEHATIYVTATPPKQLLSEIPLENIIKLPARFHKNHFQFLNIAISNLTIIRFRKCYIEFYKIKLIINVIHWCF